MNRPPLEVADIVRCAGQSFVERSRKWINGQHEKVLDGHRALSHRRARRSSRSVLGLRTYCHLLQLVPQPALPEVPGQRPPALARGAGRRELLPTRYVHARLHSAA